MCYSTNWGVCLGLRVSLSCWVSLGDTVLTPLTGFPQTDSSLRDDSAALIGTRHATAIGHEKSPHPMSVPLCICVAILANVVGCRIFEAILLRCNAICIESQCLGSAHLRRMSGGQTWTEEAATCPPEDQEPRQWPAFFSCPSYLQQPGVVLNKSSFSIWLPQDQHCWPETFRLQPFSQCQAPFSQVTKSTAPDLDQSG